MNTDQLVNDHTFHILLQDLWKAKKDKGLMRIRLDSLLAYATGNKVTAMAPRTTQPTLPAGFDPFTQDGEFTPVPPAVEAAPEEVDIMNISILETALAKAGAASGASRLQARVSSEGDFPAPEANRLLEKMGSPYRAQNQFLDYKTRKHWVFELAKVAG